MFKGIKSLIFVDPNTSNTELPNNPEFPKTVGIIGNEHVNVTNKIKNTLLNF